MKQIDAWKLLEEGLNTRPLQSSCDLEVRFPELTITVESHLRELVIATGVADATIQQMLPWLLLKWQDSLRHDPDGIDSRDEFYYAMLRSNVPRRLSSAQHSIAVDYINRSCLYNLCRQRFDLSGHALHTTFLPWMYDLNCLAALVDHAEPLVSWLRSPGEGCISNAIFFLSFLVLHDDDNPFLTSALRQGFGCGLLAIRDSDSRVSGPWLEENVASFVTEFKLAEILSHLEKGVKALPQVYRVSQDYRVAEQVLVLLERSSGRFEEQMEYYAELCRTGQEGLY